MQVKLYAFTLPLKNVFKISHTQRSEIPTVIVELEQNNVRGFGEAPLIDYYGMTTERVFCAVNTVIEQIQSSTATSPEDLWDLLHPALKDESFTQCAIDQAAHDLSGKRNGQPSMARWGLRAEDAIQSNYTIGLSTPETAIDAFEKEPDWPIYKVKLGNAHDIEVIRELRCRTEAAIRVDANQAWSLDETIEKAEILAQLGVEYIEQPMPTHDIDALKAAKEASALPLIADESCQVESDVAFCAECFHGINIKQTKCGGMTPAKRMIDAAKARGLKVMMGCMTESTVGISAIAQMTPLLDYVDMDGAYLLAQDIASGSYIESDGHIRFPKVDGNGVSLLSRTTAPGT